jgi:hypothetical protein
LTCGVEAGDWSGEGTRRPNLDVLAFLGLVGARATVDGRFGPVRSMMGAARTDVQLCAWDDLFDSEFVLHRRSCVKTVERGLHGWIGLGSLLAGPRAGFSVNRAPGKLSRPTM